MSIAIASEFMTVSGRKESKPGWESIPDLAFHSLERVTGIEPALSDWELQGSWLVGALTWN